MRYQEDGGRRRFNQYSALDSGAMRRSSSNVIRGLGLGRAALACALSVIAALAVTANAQSGGGYSSVPKQVHLVTDGDKLFDPM